MWKCRKLHLTISVACVAGVIGEWGRGGGGIPEQVKLC